MILTADEVVRSLKGSLRLIRREQVGALLQAMAPPPAEPTRMARPQARHGGGWIEVRFIPDRDTGRRYGPYLYRRWRDGRRKRTQYLGKPTTPGTPLPGVGSGSLLGDGSREASLQAESGDRLVGLPAEVPQA